MDKDEEQTNQNDEDASAKTGEILTDTGDILDTGSSETDLRKRKTDSKEEALSEDATDVEDKDKRCESNDMKVMKWRKGPVVFCAITFLLLVVYLFYNFSAILSHHKENTVMTWKDFSFSKVPQDISEKSKTVKITDRIINFKLDGQDVKTFVREPSIQGKKTPVLLLHGNAFSSETWLKLGTIQLISSVGHQVYAVDVPGYGNSPPAGNDYDKGQYVAKLIESLGLIRPILVAPSMAGSFAMPFLMKDPIHAHQKLSGFVAIAIVGTDYNDHYLYHKIQVPTMIIRGETDKKIGLSCQSNLQSLLNHEVFIIKIAGHAAYMDDPDEWHRLMYNYLFGIEKIEKGS